MSWVYDSFPVWLEESGVPEYVRKIAGLTGWILMKKLIEIDMRKNLLPDWFGVTNEELMRWTGLTESEVNEALKRLEEVEWIIWRRADFYGENMVKIVVPLPIEFDRQAIKTVLASRGIDIGDLPLRYLEPLQTTEFLPELVELYQNTFGHKMNPYIIEELIELAIQYNRRELLEVFAKAKQKGVNSLQWIKRTLRRNQGDGRIKALR